MMSRQFSISNLFRLGCSFAVFFLLSASAYSAEEVKKVKGPITITSQRLTADNQAGTGLFEISVVARTPDMTIYTDKMLVSYEKKTGNVTRIDATGKVKFIKEDRVITSQEATYYADGEKVIFMGEPRAVQGENVVTGSRMTYFMNEDRFFVEGSKVFLTKKKEQ
jgi:lipopolysaccharide export system protein LptA